MQFMSSKKCVQSRIKIAPLLLSSRLLVSIKPGGQAVVLHPTEPLLGLSVQTGPLLLSLVHLYSTEEQPER